MGLGFTTGGAATAMPDRAACRRRTHSAKRASACASGGSSPRWRRQARRISTVSASIVRVTATDWARARIGTAHSTVIDSAATAADRVLAVVRKAWCMRPPPRQSEPFGPVTSREGCSPPLEPQRRKAIVKILLVYDCTYGRPRRGGRSSCTAESEECVAVTTTKRTRVRAPMSESRERTEKSVVRRPATSGRDCGVRPYGQRGERDLSATGLRNPRKYRRVQSFPPSTGAAPRCRSSGRVRICVAATGGRSRTETFDAAALRRGRSPGCARVSTLARRRAVAFSASPRCARLRGGGAGTRRGSGHRESVPSP